ncbi:MAG: exodeoxyribonuclease V subunit alpha [Candidatus Cloacimonadota bacterium]|nr:MAG: exodeoxyribonuclease V subunit alpha [Candidatus Cloacimonadota bacterium]
MNTIETILQEIQIELDFESIQLIDDLISTISFSKPPIISSEAPVISSEVERSKIILIYFLIYMFQALKDGSVCLVLSNKQFNPSIESNISWVSDFLKNISKYNQILNEGYSNHHPILFESLDHGIKRFFFHKYFIDRNETRELLIKLANQSSKHSIDIDQTINHLYEDQFAIRSNKDGIILARDTYQIEAIKKAIQSNFLIISGGPGTGKTSLMVNILRSLAFTDVHLIAPTGRASQRMTEALRFNISTITKPSSHDLYLSHQIQGKTIHRLLKMKSNGSFYYNKKRKLKADVIIVDEASMIDADLMSALLSCIDLENTKLIFLGDKNQLPSVQAGAVFSDLLSMNDLSSSQIELKTVYRSKDILQKFSSSVNSLHYRCPDKFLNDLPKITDDQFYFLNDHTDYRESTLKSWLQLSYLSKDWTQLLQKEFSLNCLQEAFSQSKKYQVLTASRQGNLGCEKLNQWFVNQLQVSRNINSLFHGAIILIKNNDYQKKLFNGDTGIIWKMPDQKFRVFFQRADQFIDFDISDLPNWEYGFCMTVHKAQGCEFDNVLFIISSAPSEKIYNKQLVYTAITRAKKSIGILSNKVLFEKAVNTSVYRESSF